MAKPYGKKALIVTGQNSAKKSGLYDKVVTALEAAGIGHVLFDRASKNPLTTTALEGASMAVKEECDMVVAVGGGSVMIVEKPSLLWRSIPGISTTIFLIGNSAGRHCLFW